jgi:membrane associated rhomboid family serine protease
MNADGLHRGSPPAFNVPRVVIGLMAVLVAVHLIRLYGPFSDEQLIYYFAFIPARLTADPAVMEEGLFGQGARFWSLLTYGFIHADWLHLTINSVWMLAFGSVVARRLGAARFLLLSAIGSVAGALAYYAFHPGQFAVLVGASAAISAQVAAAARLMYAGPGMRWSREEAIGTRRPLSLAETFTNRLSLIFIIVWLGINYLFGALGLATPDGQAPIAWEAHLGGFLAGLLLLGLIDRRHDRE